MKPGHHNEQVYSTVLKRLLGFVLDLITVMGWMGKTNKANLGYGVSGALEWEWIRQSDLANGDDEVDETIQNRIYLVMYAAGTTERDGGSEG